MYHFKFGLKKLYQKKGSFPSGLSFNVIENTNKDFSDMFLTTSDLFLMCRKDNVPPEWKRTME
jgi:hypothetical protein